MAFNVQTFRTRTLTAAIFVVVMLAGLLINQWTFFILFSVIHFGCWVEYQKLVGLIDKEYQQITSFHKYGVMIAGWCIMLYFTNDAYKIFGLRLHELGWWMGLIFVFILPITEILFAKTIQLKNIGHSFFGLIYISLSWGLMMDLYKSINIHFHDTMYLVASYFIPFTIIISIWINDTMAYIIGSLIGKTTMSKISPKKTWEGTIGGIILSIGIASIVGFYFLHFGYFTYHLMIIAAIASIAGTFGDLLESKLKRLAGVKDSGSIMPGHGGFLDRFDSLLLAVPFVWLYIYIFVK
ncbi:MAG: phosphatidate cytidylyltransferase [Bacteroidota bacterium]